MAAKTRKKPLSHKRPQALPSKGKALSEKPANHELREKHVPGLSSRPVWQGHLRLSLVSCAVSLYKATTKENDISFHLINPKTNNRVRMIPTDPDSGPIARADLERGYEIAKNQYVMVSDEELQAVKLETTHTLDIERFVDADTIDRLFWDTPHILLPADDMAVEAYGVIRDAMMRSNRIALGRLTMHTRERLMAIEARDKGLLATTLRMRDEVVNLSKALDSVPASKPNPKMIEIAEKIISQQEGAFEPEEFRDRYEEALRDLIRRKEKGEKPRAIAEPADQSNVIDLMAALKKSLTGTRKAF